MPSRASFQPNFSKLLEGLKSRDHSCPKTEVGGRQEHAPRKN